MKPLPVAAGAFVALLALSAQGPAPAAREAPPPDPVFQAMKDENPSVVTVSRQYREPVCFNTEFNISRGR